jgi:hypothetical protein
MSGRQVDFTYTSDNGINYKIRLDRSNGRALAVGNGLQICYPAVESLIAIPDNIKPRLLYTYNRDVPRQRRRFVVGYLPIWQWLLSKENPAIVSAQYLPDSVEGINTAWIITAYTGEIIRRRNLRT